MVADVDVVSFNVKPTIDPTTVSFGVTYVDLAGNPIGNGGRIWFDDIGLYDREILCCHMDTEPSHLLILGRLVLSNQLGVC